MRKSFCLFAAVALFFVCGCDFNEKSSIKNMTLEIDSSQGEKVYFMAASMDNADIPAGSVPQFDFSTARNAIAEKNEFSGRKAAAPRNFQRYAEGVSKMNMELLRSLNSPERSAETVAYKTKIFDPKNTNTYVELLVNENSFETETEKTEKVYSGEHCNVFFVQNGDFDITRSQLSSVLETLGSLFDEKIFPNITDILGNFSYTKRYENVITCPEKVNIVVADLYYDWKESQNGGVYGYYWSADLRKDYSCNQDAIIYLDSYFLSKSPESVYSTMAHEFNHMLNYMNKGLEYNRKYSTWYTEMLSALADAMFENYLVENLTEEQSMTYDRIQFFNTWHNLGFSTWRSGTDYCPFGDVYISYGNVFAFGNFLAKNYGGFDLIREIATNISVDEDSIEQAVRKIAGKPDITFKDILKDFSCVQISNYKNDASLTLPTLNKMVVYSKNENIYLPAVKSDSAFFKDDNYTFYSDSAFCSKYEPFTPVVLGQYGFLLYGYWNGAISSIEASWDSDYNAFAYTIVGK